MRIAWKILGSTSVLLLLLLLLVTPAGAKPWHEPDADPVAVITISGPGLDGPILVSGDRAWEVLYLSTFRGLGIPSADVPSIDRLGPALEAGYRFVLSNGHVRTLHQTLYPCARDGRVWASTPSGQDRVLLRTGSQVQTGWWHSAALRDVLGRDALEGLCRDRAGALAAGAVPAGPGSPIGLWVGLAIVLVLTVAGGLVRSSLRRRQPVRA